jgi:acylphosphatase
MASEGEGAGWGVARRRFLVSGRVQGVGYRAFAARVARSLRLAGGATNLDDGTVEVIAEGPAHALDRLEAALAEGSRLARIDRIVVESLAASTPGAAGYDVEF